MKTYKESIKEDIYFKIKGENRINLIINEVIPKLQEVFKDLEGKQILKRGYGVNRWELLKKYKDKIDLIFKDYINYFNNKEYHLNLYLQINRYNIILNIKLYFYEDSAYYEGYKYLLSVENGNLKSFYDLNEFKEINQDIQYKLYLECMALFKELELKKEGLFYPLRELIK